MIFPRKADVLIAVVPAYHAGPGWSNHTVMVIYLNDEGEYKSTYIQPKDFSEDMHALFGVCAHAHAAMLEAVSRQCKVPTR